MSSTVASRARADLLRDREASIRVEHSGATARALAARAELPLSSHLGARGLAEDFPAMVAEQAVDRHLLSAPGGLLLLMEQELQRAAKPV